MVINRPISAPAVEQCHKYLLFEQRFRACGKCAISGCQVMLPNRKIPHDTFPLRALEAKYFSLAKVNNRPAVSLDHIFELGYEQPFIAS